MPTSKQLVELLKSDPGDVFLQYALAKTLASEGDAEAALVQYQCVIDQHPDYVAAYFQQGQTFAEKGRFDEARIVLARGIQVARETGDSHAEREMIEFVDSLGGV